MKRDKPETLLTYERIQNIVKTNDFKAVTYINLRGLGIRNISCLSELPSLSICLLARNRIKSLTPLMECTELVKLDASANKVRCLPRSELWLKLRKLKVLYLHNNAINLFSSLSNLVGCINLSILTLFDTPLSLANHYRHHAVNTLWSLKCLDQMVISDEEVIEEASFSKRFCAFNPHLFAGPLVAYTSTLTQQNATMILERELSLVKLIMKYNSPVNIIQRAWRKYAKYRSEQTDYLRMKFKPTAVNNRAAACIQAWWRRERERIHDDTDKQSKSRTRSHKMANLVGALGVPFRIMSERLVKSVENKTAIHAKYGSVPYQAGLANGVFTRQRTMRKSSSSPEMHQKERHTEKLRKTTSPDLCGRTASNRKAEPFKEAAPADREFTEPYINLEPIVIPTDIKETDNFRDMVLSCKEAGRVVREAANHHKELQVFLQKYQVIPVKKPSSARYANSNTQRLFNKVQDTMALSCLKAVQQAYKNRAELEKQASKMDKVLLQRHHHKMILARVDAIKNATRIETLQKREIDDDNVREKQFKLQDKERLLMLSVENKRADNKQKLKEVKSYQQFLIDFRCQNASLSKALARHDRKAVEEEKMKTTQEKVNLLRENNMRSLKTVAEYKEFVKVRRQAEAQYDKAQINTILEEERKQRQISASDRVETVKSSKRQIPQTAIVAQGHDDKVSKALRIPQNTPHVAQTAPYRLRLDDDHIPGSTSKFIDDPLYSFYTSNKNTLPSSNKEVAKIMLNRCPDFPDTVIPPKEYVIVKLKGIPNSDEDELFGRPGFEDHIITEEEYNQAQGYEQLYQRHFNRLRVKSRPKHARV